VIDGSRIGEHANPQTVQTLRRDQSFRAEQHAGDQRKEGMVRRTATVT
jgi:hypothetical protein